MLRLVNFMSSPMAGLAVLIGWGAVVSAMVLA